MKKIFGVLIITAFAAIMTLYEASACTGIYVGKKASKDGTIIIARSNDHMSDWSNYIQLKDGNNNGSGRSMPVSADGLVVTDIPDRTYRYVCTPWMDSTTASNGLTHDAAICMNECGVVMTMAVSADPNKDMEKADPFTKGGVCEQSVTDYLICQCATARDAVKMLLDTVDTYGCAEGAIAMIADRKEAWLVEMYTGYQYAAVKLPDDKVAAFGNEFTIEYLDDYEEYISSEGLESVPERNGLSRYGGNGAFNIRETYLGTANYTDYSHMRTWIGHKVLAPSKYGDYERTAQYPLVFEPDDKVSLQDVMGLLRNRYEGTKYSPDETGRRDVRVMGTDTAMSVHIGQVYPDLPPDMSSVIWECTGPCVCGVFVPVSNACTEISRDYSRNQGADREGIFDPEHYPWYAIKELNTLGLIDYRTYGEPVREYWNEAESQMAEGLKAVLGKASGMPRGKAEKLITEYCCNVQDNAFSDEKHILNDLRWYVNANANTLKKVFDPDSGLILDKDVETPPFKVTIKYHDPLGTGLGGHFPFVEKRQQKCYYNVNIKRTSYYE